jgi:histidyl-tRNA synthetase
VDYNVIRGLAYYTGVVFEAFDRQGTFRAIAGGGRYDHLIQQVSNKSVDLPAVGFGMGDVVLTELLRERKVLPESRRAVDLYVLIEDESIRMESLSLIQQLRNVGWGVEFPLTPMKSDKQFKRAQELAVTHTIKLTSEMDTTSPCEEGLSDNKRITVVKDLAKREEHRMLTSEIDGWLRKLIHV